MAERLSRAMSPQGGPPGERRRRASSEEREIDRAGKAFTSAAIPNDLKGKMVACMICSLVKKFDEFEDFGCDNCEKVLQVAKKRNSVYDYTSENFQGMVGLLDPKESWVAKYHHLSDLCPGLYAMSVRGVLSSDIRRMLARADVEYVNRDRSLKKN